MIKHIETEYKKGLSGRDIAKKLGVSHQTVYNIIKREGFTNSRVTPTEEDFEDFSIEELISITGYSQASLYRLKNEIQSCQ